MLIVEHMSNGRTVVRLHKDWHPGRISRAWMPPPQNNITGGDNYALQTALLGSKRSKRNSRSK